MSFTATPVAAGTSDTNYPVSTPNRVELSFTDDGAGGQQFINFGGVSSGIAIDMKTFFGAALFRSTVLGQRFLQPGTTQAQVQAALKDVRVTITNANTEPTKQPGFAKVTVGGVAGVNIIGPSVAGTWRVVIELRNSIEA